jgi:hypothetical protein
VTKARVQVDGIRSRDFGGIELIHMMRKQQAKYGCIPRTSLAEQFDLRAA